MQTRDRRKLLSGVGLERGAAYVQTDADEQRPFWAECQVHRISDWADRHESQVKEWFVDLGVDADTRLTDRTGGAQLIEAVRRGEVDFVVVATYDQLGQLPEGILAAIQEFARLRALVIVIDGKMPPELQMAMGPVETIKLKAEIERGTDGRPEPTLD